MVLPKQTDSRIKKIFNKKWIFLKILKFAYKNLSKESFIECKYQLRV